MNKINYNNNSINTIKFPENSGTFLCTNDFIFYEYNIAIIFEYGTGSNNSYTITFKIVSTTNENFNNNDYEHDTTKDYTKDLFEFIEKIAKTEIAKYTQDKVDTCEEYTSTCFGSTTSRSTSSAAEINRICYFKLTKQYPTLIPSQVDYMLRLYCSYPMDTQEIFSDKGPVSGIEVHKYKVID